MGVINPYSQPELEDKGWEFSSDDVTVKPDDGSVTMQSLDEELTALAQACKALTDDGYVFAIEGKGTTPLPVADYNRYWFRAGQANNNQHAVLRLSLQEAGSDTVETKELLSMLDRVGTDSIQDNAVTIDKIADNAVIHGKIAAGAVWEANISSGAVTTNKIANGAVVTDKIKDGAVTSPKLSEDVRQSLAAADGAVRYDAAQELTTEQKEQARTNITAMANTPSGDPMHYMYEAAGAEWIPYADISTDRLEDWQVATLDRAQAQADGGVWWHNDIFVTVEQNRINYIETIGTYPLILNSYIYILKQLTATTNYKQSGTVASNNDLTEFGRLSSKMCTMRLPNEIRCNNITRAFSSCNALRRIIGILNVTTVSTFKNTFSNSPNLMYVNLKGLNANIDLSGAPKLSMTSIVYAVTNAGTAPITITLAPAVYTAAMADSAVQAALADKTNVTLADAGSNA